MPTSSSVYKSFFSLETLRLGTPTQRAAAAALQECAVFERLAAFSPVLAGTVPIDVDIEGSDLDILCCAAQLDDLEAVLVREYGAQPEFSVQRKHHRLRPVVVARFQARDFLVEIFGEDCPVEQQYGYRHMVVEQRLLQVGGEKLRERIRQLKRSGMKTEPAFAFVLGLQGDPYEALLEYENRRE